MANPGGASEANVFLSFRGEDTRYVFTGNLYDALCRKGINTFIDDEKLRIGETIRPQLLQAIEESNISIVVLSENYAASTWCLDELVKIMECYKEKNQLVFPIFYRVEPSDVRRQRNSYEKAMAAHENKFGSDSERVQKWRTALSDVSDIAGYHFKEGYEYKFIQGIVNIVNKATTKVSPKQLPIEEHVVGLQLRVAEVKSLLDIESNNHSFMLGILGTGGIGKTTLAKALYNSICHQFEGACFLFDVRKTSNQDNGQAQLQQMLLLDMLEEGQIKLGSVEKGISTIKDKLSKKKVLIVLDDVDDIEQLKKLAGGCDWFGSGSRIIITTRDKYLLVSHQIKRVYKMELLNDGESLVLFCQIAFKMSHPATNYEGMCNRAIRYAKGLPLALKVISSNLIDKNLDEWKSALDKYEKNPHSSIQSILRISYDSLQLNEREIFLDIAFFFNGQSLEYVKGVLDGCDFYTEDGIRILVDKSLITIEDGYLKMHDLIQYMGEDIVKQKVLEERSRLCFHEDIHEVLTTNTGSSKIEGIKLNCDEEFNRISMAFEKMKKLRILIVRNKSISPGPIYLPKQLRLLDWEGYPSKSFPQGFDAKKIAAFNLSYSPIVLTKSFQGFDRLTYMNFSCCQSITLFPDVSGAQNLRNLILNGCKKLVKVDESIGFLPNLVYLSASECTQLRSFLPTINLPSLEYLALDLCERLARFPRVEGTMDKPLKICMKHTAIRELPRSFVNLVGLVYLDMTNCKELDYLPRRRQFRLPKVVTLKIGGCSQLRESLTRIQGSLSIAKYWPNLGTLHFSNACLLDEDVHIILQSFPNLKELNVSSNYFVSIPSCIKEFICLTSLDVSYCLNLQEIPELPSNVQKVDARHCYSLTTDTSGMLWSQVRKEINRLEIVMPSQEIPEWWDYRDQGGIPMFWARGKFPVVALVFVFDKMNYHIFHLHLYIDGEHVVSHCQQLNEFIVAEDHVLFCDLRVSFSNEEWERVHARVGRDNGWKTVQVACETDMILRQWGVYVYKQETSMDDIQFICPYPESSGTRMFSVVTNTITGPRDKELEKRSETTSSHVDTSSECSRRWSMIYHKYEQTARDILEEQDADTLEEAECRLRSQFLAGTILATFVNAIGSFAADSIPSASGNGTPVFYGSHVVLLLYVFSALAFKCSFAPAFIFLSIILSPLGRWGLYMKYRRKLWLVFMSLCFSCECTILVLSAAFLLTGNDGFLLLLTAMCALLRVFHEKRLPREIFLIFGLLGFSMEFIKLALGAPSLLTGHARFLYLVIITCASVGIFNEKKRPKKILLRFAMLYLSMVCTKPALSAAFLLIGSAGYFFVVILLLVQLLIGDDGIVVERAIVIQFLKLLFKWARWIWIDDSLQGKPFNVLFDGFRL